MLPNLSLNYDPGKNIVNFTLENLPEKESIRIKFDSLNLIDDYSVTVNKGRVLGHRIFIDNSDSSISGNIIPKDDNLNSDYLSVSLLIEIKTGTGFEILSVAASGCEIHEEDTSYAVGTIPELKVDREFVQLDEVSKIQITSTPNIFLDFKINEKTFKVKTSSSGKGSLTLNPMQFCSSYQINSNQVLRFPIQYKTESGTKFIPTGKKIHFIPEKIKALQATNNPTTPDCVILDPNAEPEFIFKFEDFDKPGYPGPIVGPLYNLSGEEVDATSTVLSLYEHAKRNNVSIISSSLLGDFDSCFINSGLSFSKAKTHLNNLDPTFARFAFSAVDKDAILPDDTPDMPCDDILSPAYASRVIVGSTREGQALDSYGVSRGMIIKPDKYYHSILINPDAVTGNVFSILMRFEDGSIVEKNYELKSDDVLAESMLFANILQSDSDIISHGITVRFVEVESNFDRIDISTDEQFTIIIGNTSGDVANAILSVDLNSNSIVELFVTDIKDTELIEKSQYILFFADKFRGIKFEIVSYANSIVALSACPGYNKPGGFHIKDFIYCLDFVAVSDVEDGGPDWDAPVISSLPFVMSGGVAVSALDPQITSSGRVVCTASVDDNLQLFLYTPDNDTDWAQLTHIGENKNPRVVEDDLNNIHIIWESDRSRRGQLYYSCLGPSSRMFANLAIDNLLAKVSESNFDEEYINLSFNSDLDILSDDSVNVVERSFSSQQILLQGYLESDDNAHIIQEFIGPSPIRFESVNIESVNNDHLFNNNEYVFAGDSSGFDGFEKEALISSLYVHIDPVGPVQTNDSSWQSLGNQKAVSFHFKSDYKIVGFSYTENELNASDLVFGPRSYRYEPHRTLDNLEYEITFDSDMKGFVLSVVFDGNQKEYQVAGLRVYVSIPYGDISSKYSGDWYRFVSKDGACSVKSKDRVTVDFNPLKSASSAVSILNKNEYGDYLDGLYSQFNYQVGFDLDLALSNRKYKPIKETGLNVDIFNTVNGKVNFQESPPLSSDPKNIIAYNEVTGSIEAHLGERVASDFIYNGSSILSIDKDEVYFSGVHFGDFVSSCYIHINPEESHGSFSSQIEFNTQILDIIWESADLQYTDIAMGPTTPLNFTDMDPRGLDSVDGTYDIKLNSSRKILSFNASFNTIPSKGVGFRVILSGIPIKNKFYHKTTEQVREQYRDFKSTFSNVSIDIFEKFNNRYNINHVQSKFDSLIPIFGSMKFDVLSSNPLSEESSGIESNQIIQLIEPNDPIPPWNDPTNRTVPTIDTISETEQFYDISANFKLDRTQTPLHHYLICLIPEVDYFTASNIETFSEYCVRTSQLPIDCKDYTGIMSESVYTGNFRIGVLACTKESLETNEQSRKRYKLVYTTSRVFDLTSDKNFVVSANYLKQSTESLDRITNYDKSIDLSSEEMSRTKEDFHWSLSLQVLINGKSGLSETFYVDMSDLRRQFDLSFGCPVFGKYISEEIIPFNGLDMSDIDLMLTYKNIRIGNDLIRFNNKLIDVGKFHRNLDSRAYYGYLGESLTNNDSFEVSVIDPYDISSFGLGDYQPLPDGNISIDDWTATNGGVVYLGSYYKSYQGSRSVLLESVEQSLDGKGSSSAPYASWTYSWSRNDYIGTGYGGGISQTLDLTSGKKYYLRMVISCRPYDAASGASLSFNKTIKVTVSGQGDPAPDTDSSKEYLAPQFYGNFTGSETDDYIYKTIIFDFVSSGRDTIEITNSTSIPEDSVEYDLYRGGIVVDQVNVFDHAYASHENALINEHDILGVSLEEYGNNFYTNAVDRTPQIPITFDGSNKSHNLYLDDFGKLHLTWQSNRDGNWNIYYASSRLVDLIFREEVKITNTDSLSSKPSVCVDNKGNRLLAWHDNRSGEYQIYSASSNDYDPDYMDPCEYDKYAYASSRLPALDPYDPYSYFIDELSCNLKFDFKPKSYGSYQFKLLFYDDENKSSLIKTISSVTNTSGWHVNDIPILSTGYTLNTGTTYTIEYTPSHEDGLENKVYHVDAYIESADSSSDNFGSVDTILSEDIIYTSSYSSFNLDGQDSENNDNNNVQVVREFVGAANRSYPSKRENDFINIEFGNNTSQQPRLELPSGTDSLRGFGISEEIASFIVHAQNNSSSGIEYSVRIDFSDPILAIIPYSGDLNETDLTLGNMARINYSDANNRGMLDDADDFITITNDLKTIIIDCHADSNNIGQMRIVTGGKTGGSYYLGKTVFYCPYSQASSCNVPIIYTNVSDSAKNVSFRVTAFNDSSLSNVVLSQYSGYDSSNFKYGINKIPYSGIKVDAGQTISLSYDPSFMDEKNIGWTDKISQTKIVSTEFNNSAEDWTCVGLDASGYSGSDEATVSHQTKANQDGYARANIYTTNEDNDVLLYWKSPVKFSGQKGQFADGKIVIRIAQNIDNGTYNSITPGSSGRAYMDDVILEDSDGIRIAVTFPHDMGQPDGEFIRYDIDLNSSQNGSWRNAKDNSVDGDLVSFDVIRNVLFGLKNLYIRAEHFNRVTGTSHDLYLDEVSLVSSDNNKILLSNRYSNLLCGVPYYFRVETIDSDVLESTNSSLDPEPASVVVFAIDVTTSMTPADFIQIKNLILTTLGALDGTNTMCGLFTWCDNVYAPIVDITYDYQNIISATDDFIIYDTEVCSYTRAFYQVSNSEGTGMYDQAKELVDEDRLFVVMITDTKCNDESEVIKQLDSGSVVGRYVTVAYKEAISTSKEILSNVSGVTNGDYFEAATPIDLEGITPAIYSYLLNNIVNEFQSYGSQSILKTDIKNVTCPCRQVGFENPRRLMDFVTWNCGASGLGDIRVSNTSSPTLNPVISSTNFGLFYVAWEDYRHSVYEYVLNEGQADQSNEVINTNSLPQVYGSLFDINENKVHGSVNAISDIQFVLNEDGGTTAVYPYPAFAPQIITDDFQNMMILTRGSNTPYLIYSSIGTINYPSEDISLVSCNLLDSTNLSDTWPSPRSLGDLQYESARLTSDSISYTTYLNASTPLSIVDDCFITFDVLGVPGTYAVRLKNENDIGWSEWMSISNDIGVLDGDESSNDLDLFRAMFSARFIDTDRFMVPWIASGGNGFKRVCFEVLTFFGKTNSFCVDFYAIYSKLNYSIDLFYDVDLTSPMNVYNDYPVVGPVKYQNQVKDRDLSSLNEDPVEFEKYYGKIVFQDINRLKKLESIFDNSYFKERFFQSEFITCTVYQQGIAVRDAVEIIKVEDGVYRAEFENIKSDGVLYKDGLGVIQVHLAGQCSSSNLDLSLKEEKRLLSTDLIEEVSIYNNQTLFIDNYNKDDLYNSFGNVSYYNKSFYNNDGSIRDLDKVSSVTNKNILSPTDFGSLMGGSGT